MEENTQPRPEKPEKEQAKESARRLPGSGPDLPSAEAYTPLPEAPRPGSRKPWLAVGAGVLALAIGAGVFTHFQPAPPPQAPPESGAGVVPDRKEKVFMVSMKDRDQEATDFARTLLQDNRFMSSGQDPSIQGGAVLPGASGVSAYEAQRQAAQQAAPSQLVAPAPARRLADVKRAEQIRRELTAAPSSLREALTGGTVEMFTFRFADFADQDGDIVNLNIDGIDLGNVLLTNAGAQLSIPLKPREQHALRVTGVHDGYGGITFALVSSVGRMELRSLAEGQSETWTIGFQSR